MSLPIANWLQLTRYALGILFASSLSAQIRPNIRPDDLVLWFDFAELDGSTVKDLSANGLDGKTSGGPVLVDAPFGKALEFDGNGDKVTVEYDPSMDVSAYSVTLWLKSVKGNEGWAGVFGRPGRHYNFWAGDSNRDAWFIHHRYKDGDNGNAGAGDYRSLAHGEWVHVGLTNDGNSTSATYVNGELKATGVVSNLTYSKNDLYIGANNDNGNGSWLEGFIDDVRLYKVALNAEEVALAYNNGEGDFNNLPVVTPVGESLVRIPLGGAYEEQGATAQDQEDGNISEIKRTIYQPATKIDSNLAAWWKLDEYSGAEANDSVLPGTVGVLKGDPLRMTGQLGWGLEVDGDDYVQAEVFDDLKNTNSGTIAFWMRPTGGNYVFWADGLALIERQGTKLRLRWNLEGDWRNSHVTQPNSLPDGEWSHWIFSFNDGVTTLYKDGLSVFTGNDDQKSFSDRVVDVKFGWRDGYAGFQGRIDDLRIYKVALDDAAALLAYQSSGRLIAETIDTSVIGDWTVDYLATDSAGASAESKRTVRIFDPVAPVITLNGEAFIQHQVLTEYNDVGATVADADGNSLDSSGIKVDGIVDGGAYGTYILAYNFTDAEGRSAETVFRTITVADNVPPILTLHGKSEVRHLLGNPYVDAGASAEDAVDGVIFVDSSLYEWDKLHARGYMLVSRPDSLMILDDNGGLLKAKPAGQNAFERRMEVNGDAAFNALGTGITINDNFQNLFTGVFRARTAGTYEFGMPWPDDLGSFWLDLDQDGIFELDGTHGSEWMDGSIRFGYGQVQLQPGVYKVAIAHMESSHGSRISSEFGLPGIVTPLGNTETFDPVEVLQVRFVVDKVNQHQPCIDELEIFSGGKNVALASLGSVATASSTANDATHNLNKVNDGLYGNSFSWRAHTTSAWVQIDLPHLMTIDRIVWSRDRIGRNGDRLPTDYRIDVMTEEGGQWVTIVEHKDRSVREIIHPGAVSQKGMWGIEKPMALDKTGSYEITYRAVDAAGNETTAKRTIVVVDSIDLPVITLLGEPRMEVSIRSEFTEPGYTVKSAFNEGLNANDVEVTGTVDTSTLGEHILTYEFVDADGIPAEVVHRTVVVVDREAPILTLLGDSEISLKLGENFNDPGVTVSDDSGAVLTASSNLGFPREGLVLHLDASRLNLSDGEAFTDWPDLSGQFNDASAFAGEPTLALKALNGRPAVQIDGQDLIRTQKSFNNRYSIFSVSRLSGSSNERLISSATNNWILGYHRGYEDRMHADQWVYMSDVTATKDPHLYSAISLGDHNTRFYADTREKVQYSSRNGQIGQLQFGGYQNGSQPGWGYIAEVLVYDHGVNADVRNSVETYLNAKYGLNGVDAPAPDLTTPGTYNLLYAARDASGNLGTTSRKIIITPDTDRPVVVLNGDILIQLEAGTEFTDPGAKATDSEGNVLESNLLGKVSFPEDGSQTGDFTLTYEYTDADGLIAEPVFRSVSVLDTTPPVITLNGEPVIHVKVGDTLENSGATATDLVDGEVLVADDLGFHKTGLILDLNAASLKDSLGNGDKLTDAWPDSSGFGNHMSNHDGPGPDWIEDGLNGEPVLRFNGDTYIWNSRNFDNLTNGYTLFTISRYSGERMGRIFSSRSRNWLFGYHGGSTAAWHAEGWIVNTDNDQSQAWHLHSGTMGNQSDPEGSFWKDGVQKIFSGRGSNNSNFKPGLFAIGGWRNKGEQPSHAEVARILLFDRVLPEEDRQLVELFLNAKYSLNGLTPDDHIIGLDSSEPGTFVIRYTASDSSGNSSAATRTIHVVEDIDIPVLTLKGEAEVTLSVHDNYQEPGVVITDSAGSDTNALTIQGDIDSSKVGEYLLTYSYTSGERIAEPVVRKVRVIDDKPPMFTFAGGDTIKLFIGQDFEEPGVTVSDNADDEIEYSTMPEGAAVYYSFNDAEAAGLDSSGNHANATLMAGAMGGGTGRYGHGLHIPQLPSACLDIGGNEVDLAEEWTIAVWFKNLYGAGKWKTLTRGSSGDHQLIVHVDNNQLGTFVNGRGDWRGSSFHIRPSQSAQWSHIAAVGQGDRTYFYKDGAYATYSDRKSATEVTKVGNWAADQHFAEYLDEFYVFKRALSEEELKGLPFSNTKIDTTSPGSWKTAYFATDSSGNSNVALRTIIVEPDPEAGIITLVGDAEITHEAGATYEDAGVTLVTGSGQTLPTAFVQVAGVPDGSTLGTYSITYNYTSTSGTKAVEVSRTVHVVDTTPPVITLVGGPIIHKKGSEFTDPGARAIDALDGEVRVIRAGVIPNEGLVLHLDAGQMEGLEEGSLVNSWSDLSPAGNDADNVKDNPTWHADVVGGRPVVRFDGGDLLWTTTDFSNTKEYSIISVARYTGGDSERVISSRGMNWLFGFHGNTYRRWYANGWIWNQGGSDTSWHLHAGSIGEDALGTFWVDRELICLDKSGANPGSFSPGVIQIGGYNDNNELSRCEVAELLFYDRKLSEIELIAVQSLLDGKYGLDFGEITTATALDVNTPGIYTLEYITADKVGNTSTASRKVVVEEGSTLPIITLNGDAELTLEAGSTFEDPGVIVTDSDGNALDASDINTSGHVDASRPGIYNLTYDFISAERQRAISVQRKITVADTVAPSINLVGEETIRIPIGGEFIDPGASAIDLADGPVEVLTSLIQKNRILHRGYQQGWNDLRLYLHDNGGLFQDQPSGQNYLDGPLYFEGDASFRAAGVGIERNDQWQNLFTSTFNARVDGKYEFAITGRDDWATFWVDLDQDGTFERNGDFGSEWMNNGVIEGGSTVHLRKGYYKVAIGQMEGGGGSRIRASFRTPEGAGPALMATIDPTDPSQDGLWVEVTELNLSQAGDHSIEYTATDEAGNQTKAVRTLTVESVKGAPAIYLDGKRAITLAAGAEWKDPGATVEDKDGNVLDASSIVTSGTVDSTVPGTYTLKYNFVDGDGIAAITVLRRVLVTDVVPPVLTLAGEAEMTVHLGSKWTDPGATATDNVDDAIPIMTSGIYPGRGLVLHLDASSIPLAKDGDPISLWRDISGQGNHLDNNIGTGRYVASDTGGLPAVQFDGQTFLATTTSFGRRYTVASVARYDGNHNLRLIASRTHNWIFGYHNNHVNCFHPAGWVAGPDLWQPADTKPHLNIGTAGGGRCQFWGDGVDLTFIPNRTGDIGQFQLGGWQTTREAASGLVSEVLIYDRVLSYGEIDALQYYLNNKYGLQDDAPVRGPVDTSSEGDFEIRYAVVDSSGNRVTKTRTVQVILAPGSPVINLLGDPVVQHEAGIPYRDDGAALIDGDGNTLDPSLIEVVGTPSGNESGEYIITYNFQDSQGRPAVERIRVVSVVDTTPPAITLLGDAVIKVEKDALVEDPGATASDLVDGEFTLPDPLKYTAGALDVVGFMNQSNDALMNINGNQGLLATDPVGKSTIYSGTLELFNDGQFRALAPSINRNDQYQVLFRGFFNAPTDGQYEFGNGDIDDRMAFWVDLDQDGIFEASGDLGSESFVSNWRNGYRNVNLSKGFYPVAILFMEYTGGARFQPSVQLPGGLRSVIHPAEQGRLWLSSPSISIDTSTPGTYSYDYVVSDQAGNEARATRTIVVVEDASLPFIAIEGGFEVHHEAGTAFSDLGAKVTDMGGNVLEADLKGEGTVDINTPGEYTLAYNYSDGAGRAASEVVRKIIVADTSAPSITLKPHPEGGLEKVTLIVGQIWEDPAATVTDSFDSDAVLVSRPTDAVAYYSFDDTQEPSRDTSEGGQFPGRFIDGARWSNDGRSGGSLHIPTASANARMEIGPVDIGDAWTTVAWFKKLYASNWRTLFRGQANDHQIIIENGQTNLGLYDSAGGKGFQGTGFHMAASNYSGWHHIAAVGKDEQTLFYVDGDYVGKVDIQSKTDIWRVGAWPGQRFAEYLDDVYIFQRALSAGEVVALMSASNGTQVDTSVPGEYKVYYHAMDAAGNVTETVRIVEIIPDPTAPLLTLNGHANIYHEAGTEFIDPGATVNLPDGTLVNANIPGVGEVNTQTLGSYSISYTYRSGDGKTALPLERTVTIRDTTAPVITLNGAETVVVALGDTFVEPGYSALDSLDGEVPTSSSAEFPKVGLMLDLDATFYEDKLEDGDLVTTPWLDASGRNHHMNLFNGSGITWHADALNGEPVLRFDGQSLMWTTKNFDDHKEGYTVLTVARYIDGTKRRIISSRSRNWLFGFHGGNSASWHPEGWVYNSDSGGDIDWHIHAGTVNNDADPAATFWKDGDLRITGNRSFNNVWNKPGQIAAGGNWGERSNCEVARILLYDRELSKESVETAMRALQSHYSLHGRTKEDKLLDTSQIGDHIVTYQTEDAAGNIATATRIVIVQDNPPIPEIVLQPGSDGDIDLVWEVGNPFVEPGFKLFNRYEKEIEANAVEVEGTVNHFTLGTYRITYSYIDEKGNPATRRERSIRVVDTTPPVITLVGGETITFEVGKPFEDPGYTAVDALDGNVTAKVSLKGRPEGLIANWTFDDGTGDKVTESISNIHATLKNFQEPNQAWQDGKFGKSIKLDGIDDYLLVSGASKLDLQKMTISLWIKASDYAQDGFLFEKTANGSVNTQYSIYFEASDELNYRLVQGGNLNDTRIPSNANFESDEWNHLAVTYDGTLKSIYVGGELVTAMPAIVPINMGPGGVSIIGANGAGNDYFFDGFIDEIQIYKRAVPEDQIHALMSTAGIDTSQKSVQPYTLVYTATDSSGNSSIAERKIIVSNDVTPPVITLIGDTEVFVDVGSVYEDFGATALDDTDGNLTPFIDDGGSLDEVDTSEPGEFIIKYDVEDFSGNKAVQVTRKVIVQSSDPFNKWAQANGLSQLSVEDRALVADPDHDGVPNLLEYALGGDPVRSNRAILPTFDNSGDNIKIFFYRIKATVDSTLELSVQLTSDLGNAAAWDDSQVELRGALKGVPQTDLPDGKPFSTSRFERFEARAKTSKADAGGKQFLRIFIEKN